MCTLFFSNNNNTLKMYLGTNNRKNFKRENLSPKSPHVYTVHPIMYIIPRVPCLMERNDYFHIQYITYGEQSIYVFNFSLLFIYNK